MESKFYECDCFTEALVVSPIPEDESVAFAVWDRANSKKPPLGWRIRKAWRVLTKGEMYKDQVILTKDKVRALRRQLNSFLFERNSKK